ncbi:MAG: hypothetical protein M1816_001372 [Peltula sp. TS41687]|nr:MAG: hypothetical protein M1816_001372 [Peltula sp. TS41687]
MAITGPELPSAEKAKRKREDEDNEGALEPRPSASPRTVSGSAPSTDKRRRVIGPSLPPAPLNEQPDAPAESDGEDSSSDGDVGPALPTPKDLMNNRDWQTQSSLATQDLNSAKAKEKPQREEWMLVPPKEADWTSRVDPTKLRNRKFNTGMGAKAPTQKSGGDHTLWTETPEQKRQRLADEMMGVRKPAAEEEASPSQRNHNSAEDQATARRIQEYNERHRDQSLYDKHKKSTKREQEDDPSKRAFDKEKDIGGGQKVGHAQRKELLNRAADFGSRFSGGNYL